MKFVIDQQLPAALARFLETQGHIAHHVREVGLQTADDATVNGSASVFHTSWHHLKPVRILWNFAEDNRKYGRGGEIGTHELLNPIQEYGVA